MSLGGETSQLGLHVAKYRSSRELQCRLCQRRWCTLCLTLQTESMKMSMVQQVVVSGPTTQHLLSAMPAKKRAVSKRSAGAEALEETGGENTPPGQATWLARRANWLKDIHDCRLFGPNVAEEDANDVSNGGFQAKFNPRHCTAAMTSGLDYTAGGHFMWIDHLKSVNPEVPIMEARVMDLAAQMPDAGQKLPWIFTVSANFKTGDQLPRGALFRVSPEEVCDAVLLTISRDIQLLTSATAADTKAGITAKLHAWKKTLASVTMSFVRLDGADDAYYWSLNARELTRGTAHAVAYNPLQDIMDINAFKRHKEKALGRLVAAKELSDLYASHIKFVGGKNPRGPTVVDAAVTIHNRMLKNTECFQCVMRLETLYPGRIVQVWKLQELLQRCQTLVKLQWCLAMILDLLVSGAKEPDDFPVRALGSKANPGKGMTDYLLMKRTVKVYLLNEWLDARALPVSVKVFLRETMDTVASYREKLRPLSDEETVRKLDLTFLSRWPKSALKTLELFEALIYASTASDEGVTRLAMKHGRSASELLDFSPYKEWVTDIDGLLRKESDPDAGTVPKSSSPGADAKAAMPVVTVVDDNDMGADMERDYELESFKRVASNWVSQYCKLVVMEETTPQKTLVEILKACPLAGPSPKPNGTDSGTTLIWADSSQWGRAQHKPWVRLASVNKEVWMTLMSAVQEVRGVDKNASVLTLPIGDVWFFIDGGVNRRALFLKSIKGSTKSNAQASSDGKTMFRDLTIMKDGSTLLDRQRRSRGHMQIHTTERAFVAFNALSTLPKRHRKHYEGTNKFDSVGPVRIPAASSLPHMTPAELNRFWDWRSRPCGGKVPGEEGSGNEDEEDESADEKDQPEEASDGTAKQPVNWHTWPSDFLQAAVTFQTQPVPFIQLSTCEFIVIPTQPRIVSSPQEVLHSYWVAQTIDLMPGDGSMAIASITSQIPFLGICHSEFQRDWIVDRLNKSVLEMMGDASSRFANHRYLLHLKKETPPAAATDPPTSDSCNKKEQASTDAENGDIRKAKKVEVGNAEEVVAWDEGATEPEPSKKKAKKAAAATSSDLPSPGASAASSSTLAMMLAEAKKNLQ